MLPSFCNALLIFLFISLVSYLHHLDLFPRAQAMSGVEVYRWQDMENSQDDMSGTSTHISIKIPKSTRSLQELGKLDDLWATQNNESVDFCWMLIAHWKKIDTLLLAIPRRATTWGTARGANRTRVFLSCRKLAWIQDTHRDPRPRYLSICLASPPERKSPRAYALVSRRG